MKNLKRILSAVVCVISMNASADLINLNVNPSNMVNPSSSEREKVVYEVDGTYWGLLGLSGGASDYLTPNSGLLDDLWASVASGNVLGFYYADNMPGGDWAGSYTVGQMLDANSYIASTYNGGDKFFDAIWVNFKDGNVVFAKPGSGTNTLGAGANYQGAPFATSQAVPAPATLLLFAAGLFSLVRFSRKS